MDTTIGVIGLALAVIGAAARRDRWVAFWVILAGAAGMMMLGRFTFLMDLFPHIPIVGSGRIPVRYHLWLVVAVSALAAVGADRLVRPGGVQLRGVFLVFGILVVASIAILAYTYAPIWTDAERWVKPYHLQRKRWLAEELTLAVARTAILGTLAIGISAAAGRIRRPSSRRNLAATLPLLLIVELLVAHRHEVPTIDPRFWTVPPHTADYLKSAPDLIRVSGLAALSAGEPGFATKEKSADFFRARETLAWSLAPVWGLRSSTGITPIISRRYLAYADNAVFGGGRFDVEGVSHVITGPFPPIFGWGPPVRVGSALIHHNPHVLPRARLVTRPVYVASEAEAVKALISLGTKMRDHVIIEDPTRPLKAETGAPAGIAKILRDEPERVEISTDSQSDAYLVLSDLYDPGWRATLDGKLVPIRHAQVAFRGVYVPRGEHVVVFHYRPAGFHAGLLVTCAGACFGLLALGWPRPAAALRSEHALNDWPRNWLRIELGVILLILILSTITVENGRPAVQNRWKGSWHRFTWAAKILAMRK
jgi:hypothetical protein